MNSTIENDVLHIAFLGRKNVGKSSLINAFTGQNISLVSPSPGTTKEAVKKSFEIESFGLVALIDTAGIDGKDDLGINKISKTMRILSAANFAVIVLDARVSLSKEEIELIIFLNKINVPFLIAVNKIEFGINPLLLKDIKELNAIHFEISIKENVGLDLLRYKIIRLLPNKADQTLLGELLNSRDIAIIVVSDDSNLSEENVPNIYSRLLEEAESKESEAFISSESDFSDILKKLTAPPNLVVTQNNDIGSIAKLLPPKVKVTTFSVLMAARKGNLQYFIQSLKILNKLKSGDKILMSEACPLHSNQYNVGSNAISNLLNNFLKKDLEYTFISGDDFPENLTEYKLIIHCDGCIFPQNEMRSRLKLAILMDIPVISYGVLLSYIKGAFPKAIQPFKDALCIFNNI